LFAPPQTAPVARNIPLLSKNAARRITLGVRLNMMQSYRGGIALSINPVLLGRAISVGHLTPGFLQYRMPIMQLNVGQIT